MQPARPAQPSQPAPAPLREHQPVPTTPGRIALLAACAGLLTCGLLSPIALLMSVIALVWRADRFGLAAVALSGLSTLALADVTLGRGYVVLTVLWLVG